MIANQRLFEKYHRS